MITKEREISLLETALAAARSGDDEILDRCYIELTEDHDEELITRSENRIFGEAAKVPGGYRYDGVCSSQVCFPLRAGGELRLSWCEADDADGTPSDNLLHVDHYGGELPPGITGPAWPTADAPRSRGGCANRPSSARPRTTRPAS
jgi:hypothetical protein